MDRHLAENKDFKVYNICENVYLKNKNTSINLNSFEKTDINIGWHYGDPNNAIIMHKNNYIVVSGCGLLVYDTIKNTEKHILSEVDELTWTQAVFQEQTDDQILEFRFVALNKAGNLRVFKMNLETFKIIEL